MQKKREVEKNIYQSPIQKKRDIESEFHLACRHNDITKLRHVKTEIELVMDDPNYYGAIDPPDNQYNYYAIERAAKNGDLVTVTMLVKRPSLDMYHKNLALLFAIDKGDLMSIEALVTQSSVKDCVLDLAYQMLAESNYVEIEILKSLAKVNFKSAHKDLIFAFAVTAGQFNIVEFILPQYVLDQEKKQFYFNMAMSKGYLEIVRILADDSTISKGCSNILHHAVAHLKTNNPKMVICLLNLIEVNELYQKIILNLASQNSVSEVIEYMEENYGITDNKAVHPAVIDTQGSPISQPKAEGARNNQAQNVAVSGSNRKTLVPHM